jgi:mersacidin/lichenicidin family type 2 lantibiotic
MKRKSVRAWKDEASRESLSQEQKAQLLAHPAGELEMSDAELATVVGAGGSDYNDDCNDDPCYDPCDSGLHRSRSRHSGSGRGFDYVREYYGEGSFQSGSFGDGDC